MDVANEHWNKRKKNEVRHREKDTSKIEMCYKVEKNMLRKIYKEERNWKRKIRNKLSMQKIIPWEPI